MEQASETPKSELKWKRHHNCFSPQCRNFTFLRDHAGWVWCTKHYWRALQNYHRDYKTWGSYWRFIKWTEIV